MIQAGRDLQALMESLGLRALSFLDTTRRLAAFTLITIGVIATRAGTARRVIHPLIRTQLVQAGILLLPIVAVVGMALGFAIVGQTLSILTRVGQTSLIGSLFVTVIFRELAPLCAALVVLARVGTPTVVELGTSRALGEVEALEALGIDPVHYLVVPRVVGITLAVASLTVYIQLFAALSGWLFCFVANLPVGAGDYLGRIAGALHWFDFPVLGGKTLAFGASGSLIACYQGLSRPLRLEEVPGAATRTVAHSVVAFLLLDALFLVITLLLPG